MHSLQLLQDSVLLTDENWKDFTGLLKSTPGFFFGKDKLPELSPAETRFAVLTKLKLSIKRNGKHARRRHGCYSSNSKPPEKKPILAEKRD
jgi:hypothetical protein